MTLLNLKESFNLFKKNLILIVPDTISLLITSLLLASIYLYIGFSDILPLVQSAEDLSFDILKNFLSANLMQIIISVILFTIITFIVGVGVTTIKFDMITDLMHNKKVSLRASSFKSKSFFWPVVLLRACMFIIFAISLLLILLVGGLFYILFNGWGSETAMIISFSILIPLAIVLFVFLKLLFLFIYQIMFLKVNKNPIKVIKESLKLFKKNISFVVISGLLVFGLGLFVAAISNIISQLIEIIPVVSVYLSPLWSVIQMFLSIAVSLISSIYLFLQLKLKKD